MFFFHSRVIMFNSSFHLFVSQRNDSVFAFTIECFIVLERDFGTSPRITAEWRRIYSNIAEIFVVEQD